MAEAIKNSSKDSAAQKLSEAKGLVKEAAQEGFESGSHQIRDSLTAAGTYLEDLSAQTRDVAKKTEAQVRERVTKSPWKSLAVAALAGSLVAMLFSRKRKP